MEARRPKRVGLACAEGDPVGLVLDDMADAGAVYEMLSKVEDPIEFVRLRGLDGAETCDALVLADGLEAPAGMPAYRVSANDRGADLYVPRPRLLPRLMKKPRLGHARRPLSEAVDALLLRIRSGEPPVGACRG